MKKPRIQDIAKVSGVSPSTVARVLRDESHVSSEKKELVMNAARELGYDLFKQTPVKKIPQILIVSYGNAEDPNPLFARINEAICLEFQKRNYYCVFHYVDELSTPDIISLVNTIKSVSFDGVVFTCIDYAGNLAAFQKLLFPLSIPAVMIERFPDVFGINKLMIDSQEALFLAVKYLHEQGHRRIALLSPDTPYEVEQMRKKSFWYAAEMFGIKEEAHFIPVEAYNGKSARKALEDFTAQHDMPTGIICSDILMTGVYHFMYKRNIHIPDEVSLIGLDNTFAKSMSPPLTSVAFPIPEIAAATVQMLIDNPSSLAKTVSLSTYLVERESVAKAPTNPHSSNN